MSRVPIKITLHVEIEEIQAAMKERGLKLTKTNMNLFLKIISNGGYTSTPELYKELPRDRETLLIYGFKLERSATS